MDSAASYASSVSRLLERTWRATEEDGCAMHAPKVVVEASRVVELGRNAGVDLTMCCTCYVFDRDPEERQEHGLIGASATRCSSSAVAKPPLTFTS